MSKGMRKESKGANRRRGQTAAWRWGGMWLRHVRKEGKETALIRATWGVNWKIQKLNDN
jgi:hypothetical protein